MSNENTKNDHKSGGLIDIQLLSFVLSTDGTTTFIGRGVSTKKNYLITDINGTIPFFSRYMVYWLDYVSIQTIPFLNPKNDIRGQSVTIINNLNYTNYCTSADIYQFLNYTKIGINKLSKVELMMNLTYDLLIEISHEYSFFSKNDTGDGSYKKTFLESNVVDKWISNNIIHIPQHARLQKSVPLSTISEGSFIKSFLKTCAFEKMTILKKWFPNIQFNYLHHGSESLQYKSDINNKYIIYILFDMIEKNPLWFVNFDQNITFNHKMINHFDSKNHDHQSSPFGCIITSAITKFSKFCDILNFFDRNNHHYYYNYNHNHHNDSNSMNMNKNLWSRTLIYKCAYMVGKFLVQMIKNNHCEVLYYRLCNLFHNSNVYDTFKKFLMFEKNMFSKHEFETITTINSNDSITTLPLIYKIHEILTNKYAFIDHDHNLKHVTNDQFSQFLNLNPFEYNSHNSHTTNTIHPSCNSYQLKEQVIFKNEINRLLSKIIDSHYSSSHSIKPQIQHYPTSTTNMFHSFHSDPSPINPSDQTQFDQMYQKPILHVKCNFNTIDSFLNNVFKQYHSNTIAILTVDLLISRKLSNLYGTTTTNKNNTKTQKKQKTIKPKVEPNPHPSDYDFNNINTRTNGNGDDIICSFLQYIIDSPSIPINKTEDQKQEKQEKQEEKENQQYQQQPSSQLSTNADMDFIYNTSTRPNNITIDNISTVNLNYYLTHIVKNKTFIEKNSKVNVVILFQFSLFSNETLFSALSLFPNLKKIIMIENVNYPNSYNYGFIGCPSLVTKNIDPTHIHHIHLTDNNSPIPPKNDPSTNTNPNYAKSITPLIFKHSLDPKFLKSFLFSISIPKSTSTTIGSGTTNTNSINTFFHYNSVNTKMGDVTKSSFISSGTTNNNSNNTTFAVTLTRKESVIINTILSDLLLKHYKHEIDNITTTLDPTSETLTTSKPNHFLMVDKFACFKTVYKNHTANTTNTPTNTTNTTSITFNTGDIILIKKMAILLDPTIKPKSAVTIKNISLIEFIPTKFGSKHIIYSCGTSTISKNKQQTQKLIPSSNTFDFNSNPNAILSIKAITPFSHGNIHSINIPLKAFLHNTTNSNTNNSTHSDPSNTLPLNIICASHLYHIKDYIFDTILLFIEQPIHKLQFISENLLNCFNLITLSNLIIFLNLDSSLPQNKNVLSSMALSSAHRFYYGVFLDHIKHNTNHFKSILFNNIPSTPSHIIPNNPKS